MNKFEFAEAYTRFTSRDSEFHKGMARVQASLRKVQTHLEAVSRHARRMLMVAGGALGVFVKLASDAAETSSKFDAVFKEHTEAAREWAHKFAAEVGRSKYAIEGYMSTFQDTFVPLGYARAEAMELSKQLTKLALDLASFNNQAEPETIQLLTSALVGNHEAVRRYGIILTQSTLDQELLNMGIKGGAKAAENQQKVMARLNIIMKSTTDAQGDLKRTGEETANQWKKLRGELEEMAVELGKIFIPLAKQVIKVLGEWSKRISEFAKGNKEAILFWTAFTAAALGFLVIAPKLVIALKLIAGALGGLGALALGLPIATGAIGPLFALMGGLALACGYLTAKAVMAEDATEKLNTRLAEEERLAAKTAKAIAEINRALERYAELAKRVTAAGSVASLLKAEEARKKAQDARKKAGEAEARGDWATALKHRREAQKQSSLHETFSQPGKPGSLETALEGLYQERGAIWKRYAETQRQRVEIGKQEPLSRMIRDIPYAKGLFGTSPERLSIGMPGAPKVNAAEEAHQQRIRDARQKALKAEADRLNSAYESMSGYIIMVKEAIKENVELNEQIDQATRKGALPVPGWREKEGKPIRELWHPRGPLPPGKEGAGMLGLQTQTVPVSQLGAAVQNILNRKDDTRHREVMKKADDQIEVLHQIDKSIQDMAQPKWT